MREIFAGLLLPLLGTSLGAACVFFVRRELNRKLQNALLGFAAGVMVASSVWSLLIPAIELSGDLGRLAFLPAVGGLGLSFLLLLALDRVFPQPYPEDVRGMETYCGEDDRGAVQPYSRDNERAEGVVGEERAARRIFGRGVDGRLQAGRKRMNLLMLAVTLHNVPEGMAVGAVFAGLLAARSGITLAGAFALSAGIAIQNFPEGAIISLPLAGEGRMSRRAAFGMGVASGVVEPLAGTLMIALSHDILPLLPCFLAFAAGAMLYVVVEELIPETTRGTSGKLGTIGFALGFMVMLVLDVAFG